MHKNLGDSFDRKHFSNDSNEWTVILIASLITLLLVFSYIYYNKYNQKTHSDNESKLAKLENKNNTEVSSNNDAPLPDSIANQNKSYQIYKCTVKGKTSYSETSCPSEARNENLQISYNSMDSEYLRRHINDAPRISPFEKVNDGPTYMSDHDINIRIKELESTIASIAVTRESIGASQQELSYMHAHPRQLNQSDEIRRRNLRVDLERLDDEARFKALHILQNEIFIKY